MAKKAAIPTIDNYELPAVTNVQAVKAEPLPEPELPKVSPDDISKFISANGGSPTVDQIDAALKLFIGNKNVEMFVRRLNDLEMYASGDELTTIQAIKATMK